MSADIDKHNLGIINKIENYSYIIFNAETPQIFQFTG